MSEDPYEHKTDIQILDEIENLYIMSPDAYENNNYEFGKGGTVNYYTGDTYERLVENKKMYRDELEIYDKYPVTYKLNKQGFRSDIEDYTNLYDQEVEIILGCSFTFGIGFNLEHTWPVILDNLLEQKKVPKINLSIPGTGGDTAFRLLATYLNKFKKIKRIIHLQPFYARFEILSEKIALNFHATEVEDNPDVGKHFTKLHKQECLVNRRTHIVNHIKNISACKGLADLNNIPYHYLPLGHSVLPDNLYEIHARDIIHGGFTGQFNIAYNFAKKINNEDTRVDLSSNGADHFGNSDNTEGYIEKFPEESFIDYVKNNSEVLKFYPNAFYSKFNHI